MPRNRIWVGGLPLDVRESEVTTFAAVERKVITLCDNAVMQCHLTRDRFMHTPRCPRRSWHIA